MKNNHTYLVIDIGGTAIKYARITDNCEITEKGEVPTILKNKKRLMEQLFSIYKNISDVEGISISMPGIVDMEKGYVYTSGTLECIYNEYFAKELEKELQKPVTIINDANAATYAELKYGKLKGINTGVVLIIGTAIGGGIVIDGKIVQGSHFSAGEFSVIAGNIHHPEDISNIFAYTNGIKALSKEIEQKSNLKNLNGIEIFDLAETGNEKVIEGLMSYCEKLIFHINNLQYILDPELFVIGGGISQRPILLDIINQINDNWVRFQGFVKPKITTCQYYNDSNLIGALAFHIDYLNRLSEKNDMSVIL